MKKHLTTILLVLIFIAGVSLILYPTVSDYLNARHQSRAISTYAEQVEKLDEVEYETFWTEAQEYNESLAARPTNFKLSDEEEERYNNTLNVADNGVMGYIEIPAIQVSLPIYHGTNESVLQTAIGHLEWTSLPVGGESSHCVLSGHRGLPSAKLFTNLDKLVIGDTFTLRVLDEILTYEVDQILIVEPKDVVALQIVEGEDYCTLVTCTPYGINTHRLLVRGHRIENPEEAHNIYVTADAEQMEPVMVAAMLAIPILLLLVIALLIPKKRRNEEDDA